MLLPDLDFTIEVGPITTDQYLIVRWKARGHYGGGFPGASPDAVGREIVFTGTDTLRIENGKLAEYWGERRQPPLLLATRCFARACAELRPRANPRIGGARSRPPQSRADG